MFSDITAWWVDVSASSSRQPPDEKPLPVCGIRAYRQHRLKNPDVTPCVLAPGHEGKHVYCVKSNAGIDRRSHSLHYYREVTRKVLQPDAIFEMDGPWANETYEACAALYQFMEELRRMRGINPNGT